MKDKNKIMNIVNEIRNDWKSDEHVNGRVAGNVNDIRRDVTWFVLSDGRVVSFHKAWFEHPANNENAKYGIFFSDNETFASVTAQNLGIDYALLVNASDAEAEQNIIDQGLEVKERLRI